MSTGSPSRERNNQKRRTRTAILVAAAALVRQGKQPSVAEAADAAQVSRATAYRYFPSQERLLLEAALETTTPVIDALIAQTHAAADVASRVDGVVHAIQTTVAEHEGAFRMMLRSALEAWPAPARDRGARRITWMEEALAPARAQLPAAEWERLVAALTLCVGIESLVVLRDVCELDAAAAEAVTRWAAHTLLQGALAQAQQDTAGGAIVFG